MLNAPTSIIQVLIVSLLALAVNGAVGSVSEKPRLLVRKGVLVRDVHNVRRGVYWPSEEGLARHPNCGLV